MTTLSTMPEPQQQVRPRRRFGVLTWIPLLALAALAIGLLRARGGEARPLLIERTALPSVALEPVPPLLGGATVRGVVRSAGGAAVTQALVLAREGDAPIWSYTDERGAFALAGLSPGSVSLRVCARRFEVEDFWVDAPSEDVRLLLTNELDTPPALPPLEAETLVGEVLPPSPDWVVTGYELVLVPEEPLQTLDAPVPRRAPVRADRSFRFEDLTLGRYRVLLLPPWARGGSWPDLATASGSTLVHARTGAQARLAVTLEAGILESTVTDTSGTPLEGALVLVHPVGDEARLWPPFTTGSEGRLRLRDLPPGAYAVTVTAGEAELSRVVEIGAGATHRLDLPPLSVGPR